MSRSFVVAMARKDVARRFRDPYAFLIWLAIPIVLGGMMALLNSGSGKPRGRLLVADRDGTFLSRSVASAFAQKPLAEFFDVETVDEAAGRARMDAGDASALVVLPEGFQRAVLEDTPATIEVVKNPSQHILPAIAEETLGLLSEAVFYGQRVAGDRLRDQVRRISEASDGGANPWTEAFASDFGAEIHRTIERLSKYLAPPVLEVDVAQEPDRAKESGPSFGALFFPSMLVMSLFFLAQGLSDDVWTEKHHGTLRRALAAPVTAGAFLAGKLAAAAAICVFVAVLGLVLGGFAFGIPASTMPLAALWVVGCGVVLTAALDLLQLVASTQRAGHLLTNAIGFPLMMIGGGFFPFEVMPAGFAGVGRRTPLGWMLEELKAILFARASAGDVLLGFAMLAGGLLLLVALCRARLAAFARS
jgi:ABC-type Na+ efflux pump permease subunit